MDPELLRLLLALLRDQTTTGSTSIGGDWPYDDHNIQDTIGGLSATDTGGPVAPVSRLAEMDAGTSGEPVGSELLQLEPSQAFTWLPYVPPSEGWVDVPYVKRPEHHHPQPKPTGPTMYEDGSMENPFAGHQQKRPFGGDPRQVFGRGQPSNAKEMRPAAGPQPAPTAEPVARFNDALPKAKQRQTKSLPKRQNAQQAVQQITRQAAATQPQRQFSAPAPTFTNAPASRSAAQNSLANTLNLMRSLSRR